MHDTKQLRRCGRKDDDISQTFIGVFLADEIPLTLPSNCCFIANTDPKTKAGQHWVTFFVTNEKKMFFDSYGNDPRNFGVDLKIGHILNMTFSRKQAMFAEIIVFIF